MADAPQIHNALQGIRSLPKYQRAFSSGIFVFLVATLLALMEVQIEGSNGWAAALPTWRVDVPIVRILTGDRALTGYHLYLLLLLLALLHTPLLFTKVTRELEARLLGWFLFLSVVWDFLWFVWNPSFGILRFRPDDVWWYSHWAFGFPVDYYVGLGLSLLIYIAGARSRDKIRTQVQEWIGTAAVLLVLIVVTVVATSF